MSHRPEKHAAHTAQRDKIFEAIKPFLPDAQYTHIEITLDRNEPEAVIMASFLPVNPEESTGTSEGKKQRRKAMPILGRGNAETE